MAVLLESSLLVDACRVLLSVSTEASVGQPGDVQAEGAAVNGQEPAEPTAVPDKAAGLPILNGSHTNSTRGV